MQFNSRRIAAVVLDIDGTLAREDHAVSADGYLALTLLKNADIPTILLTGRSESAALQIARQGNLSTPVISSSGSVVTDPVTTRRIDVRRMQEDRVASMLRFADEYGLQPFLFNLDGQQTDRHSDATRVIEAINGEPIVVDSNFNTSDPVKVMFSATAARLDELRPTFETAFPEMQRTLPEFVEAGAPDSDKSAALKRVLLLLDINPGRVLGFGDADADADWLSKIGIPVAVENASDRVLEVASVVIGHHRDDAVALSLLEWLRVADAASSHAATRVVKRATLAPNTVDP